MKIAVLVPCQILNLMVKTTEECSVLSVFSLPQLLKKFQSNNSNQNVFNSIPPKNAALHLEHVPIDHKHASNISLRKLIKDSYKKKKLQKGEGY